MTLTFFANLFSPPLIALFAILVLAYPKPSVSAMFLFLQSILINISLFFIGDNHPDFLATSILLSFISMIVIGANMFIETSYKNPARRMIKFNIFIGAIFAAIFWLKVRDMVPIIAIDQDQNTDLPNHDSFTLLTIAFSIFTILASSFAILDIKQWKKSS